ncbi:MAG: hypothetical protein EDM75_03160 [Chlorobiota bacterium]|nr:MAG: hypothetical protein EDM75_03160 [Chlorobiota bacterium]
MHLFIILGNLKDNIHSQEYKFIKWYTELSLRYEDMMYEGWAMKSISRESDFYVSFKRKYLIFLFNRFFNQIPRFTP